MNKIILLADKDSYQKEVDDLLDAWLDKIFLYLKLDPNELKKMEASKFVDMLFNINLDIIGYPKFGAVSVIYKGEIIGEWAGPELKLKKDEESGSLYYEISIEEWSVLDEEIYID